MQAQGSVFLVRGWGLAQDYNLCTYGHCWFTLLQVFETFTAQLSVPSGQNRVMLGANSATVEITDDDSE